MLQIEDRHDMHRALASYAFIISLQFAFQILDQVRDTRIERVIAGILCKSERRTLYMFLKVFLFGQQQMKRASFQILFAVENVPEILDQLEIVPVIPAIIRGQRHQEDERIALVLKLIDPALDARAKHGVYVDEVEVQALETQL